MGIVIIDNIQPGMVLEQEIRDRSGRLLLPVGAAMTETSIRMLKMWGIHEAYIVGQGPQSVQVEGLTAADQHLLERAEIEVQERFLYVDRQDPFFAELIKLLVHHHACALKQQGEG